MDLFDIHSRLERLEALTEHTCGVSNYAGECIRCEVDKRHVALDELAKGPGDEPSEQSGDYVLKIYVNAAFEKAAKACDAMAVGGRAWTEDQETAAKALFAAAAAIRDLKE